MSVAITTPDGVWQAAERLVKTEIPLYDKIWEFAKQRHGFRAALAVLEVAVLRDIETIRSPAAYLAGIIKKPPLEWHGDPDKACAPHITLARLAVARSGFAAANRKPIAQRATP
ncbi:Protein of unknown function (plasmid) [Magnetospira sp. QH-2]|nr:Protein of unknown function [Magnetospira sp. QH-2]